MEKKRIAFLDFSRGLAILFMIMQHAMILFDQQKGEGGILGITILLLGTAPAAPVFMIIMGIFFSKKKEIILTKEITRGIKLIFIGYILNFFRFFIPSLAENQFVINTPVLTTSNCPIAMLLSIDILQMAGYSWIVMAFLKKYSFNAISILTFALCITTAAPFLWRESSLYTPLASLWGTGENVYFPLLPWLIYPLIGMATGPLIHTKNNAKLLKKGTLLGALFILAGTSMLLFLEDFKLFCAGDYHRSGISIHLIIIGFIAIWFWLSHFLLTLKPIQKLMPLFTFWSKNVTTVYIIQWTLFGFSFFFLDQNQFSEFQSFSLGILIVIISHLLLLTFSTLYPNPLKQKREDEVSKPT